MKKHLVYLLAAISILAVSCQKELSFEGSNTPATGSLQSDVTGDCLPKTVNGLFLAGAALIPATNTISVQVNVTKTGSFVVYTDTVNGYFFRATGTFTTLGANTVTLRGFGTPFLAAVNNFVVYFDTTFCDIQVTVISPGIGTLAGAPNACAPITVNGGYSPGVALTSGNNVVVQADITTAGIINITTDTVAGIWFTFSGSLSVGTGQNITLAAFGSIPGTTTPGNKTFTVKFGTSQCTFVVNVSAPAVGTVDCSAATINGTYAATVPLTASNTAVISVNVTTAGSYTITTDTVNGIWFNASGNFPTAPATVPVTLAGQGTPTASGTFTLTVKFGASTCTFQVVCTAAPVVNWKFNIGATVYQGTSSTVPLEIIFDNTTLPPATFLFYTGYNAALDQIDIDLADLIGGITAAETYNTNSTGTTNAADFYFTDGLGTLDLVADQGQTAPPANITYTITSHNTVTKTIIGTFTGTAYDFVSSTVKNITLGTFNIVYP